MLNLIQWCKQLGSYLNHNALLVCDERTPWLTVQEILLIAKNIFGKVEVVSAPQTDGWPLAANILFRRACEVVTEPFLWFEPDATLIRASGLDEIDAAYQACGKRYMGHIYREIPKTTALIPRTLMSGIAVYPADTFKSLPSVFVNGFDMDLAEIFVKDAADTKLIQHVWGEVGNPPRFEGKAVHGTAVFDLDSISKEAAIFHRCKDGSLIRQLRKKMGIPDPEKLNTFVTVLPFFQKDAHLALKNIKWQKELGGCKKYDCLLAYEANVDATITAQILAVAQSTYKTVFVLKYPPARVPGWPSGPNWGFQHVANYMEKMGRSWLFMEPDMFAIVSSWNDQLQEGYAHCGKACMGHLVKDFGHLQGTSIYPADLPTRFPKMMAATTVAFDTVSKDEILKDCHDAGNLMAHIWGLQGDTPHHFTGNPIHFSNADQVRRWVPQGAVTLHRCKDGSIADRLREMKVI